MYEEPSALEAEGAERVNRLEAEERPPVAGRPAAGRGRVELEVLRRLVPDVAPVEDHPTAPLPAGHVDRVLGAGDVVRHPGPDPRLEHPRLEPQPGMKRHLDRVLGRRALHEVEDLAAEKGPVHAEFEAIGAPERRAELREEVTKEAPRALAVVDVAGPVLDPQDLPALRLVGRDRIVARHLAPMGLER